MKLQCMILGVPEERSMKGSIRPLIRMTILLFLVCGLITARAQSNSATVTGTVTDKTGALIPHATIAITDQSSGVKRETHSDNRGVFSFVGVPVGVYSVAVSAPGFNTLVRPGIAVHINDQIDLKEIALPVGTANASVTVTAEESELTPTTSGEVSYTITDAQLHDMDIEGRSAIELLGLIPGASNTGNWNGTYNSASAGFTQNASAFTVNGNRFDQVSIESDGASVVDLNTAGAAAVTPNVDMIAELKVQSAAYSVAEPNGPIVVSSQTKSGGREIHGLAELTVRDHVLNASDWQEKANGLPAPNTSLFYPAFQVGGPIKKFHSDGQPKLFYFLGTEFSQQHVDLIPRKALVPTAAMRNGDFSDSAYLSAISNQQNNWADWQEGGNPCNKIWKECNSSGANGWGQIDANVIDPGGKTLLNALPLPNVDPSAHGGINLLTDFVVSEPRNQEVLKLDYALNDNTHASIRYNHENESVPSPYGPWNTWNQTPYPAAQTLKNASNSINMTVTSVLTSSLTNEASIAYTRIAYGTQITNAAVVSATALKYPYANLFQTDNSFLPNVGFDGTYAGGLYLSGGEKPGYVSAQNMYTVNEGLTKLKGVHLIRFGVFGQMGRFNNRTGGSDNGGVNVSNYATVSGNDWADLLLGNITSYGQSSTNIEAGMENNRFDFYGEDVWKLAKRLTVNYGLRVDHIGWWYDRAGRISIFNPAAYNPNANPGNPGLNTTGLETHSSNPSVPRSGWKPLGFEWAPGVGFAYDFSGNGKTVVRGGFGTNYYVDPGTNAFSAIQAPPLFKVVGLYSGSKPLTLSGLSQLTWQTQFPSIWGAADPKDHHAPLTYSWNLALSHLFWGANKVEVNYVGNSSHNLLGWGSTNVVPAGSETPATGYGTAVDQTFRPYPTYTEIAQTRHNLDSNYNALQLTVARQKGWLNYWGSYAFGKALGYNAEDAFDIRRWYNPVAFDRSQVLSFSYYLDLPNVSKDHLGNHKLANAVLDGWRASGIFQASSGTPFLNSGEGYSLGRQQISIWANSGFPGPYNSYVNGTPDEIAVPVVTCDPRKGITQKNQYFNPACFAGPTLGQNGTYRLPYIHGPAYINDSTGLFKSFNLAEKRSIEIRGETFNLFNHPWNWFKPYDANMYMGFNADGSAAGSTASNPAGSNIDAGLADNKTGHREFSLMVRFNF